MPTDPLSNPPHDPALESLLDDALAPAAPPPGLADRVLRRTPRVAASPPTPAARPAVIGRIGVALAMAAGLAGLATVAWRPWGATEAPDTASLASLAEGFDTLAAADALTQDRAAVDHRIETLELRVALLQGIDPLAGYDEALTEAATSRELDQWSDDLPLLF